MSQYLKRIVINEVEGLTEIVPTQYLKTVTIVGFEDNDGDNWEPIPNYDDLAVVSKSSTTGSTVLGSTLKGTPAIFTGGVPPVEAISQWQVSDDGTNFAGFTPWVAITDPVEYTTDGDDNGKYIRLASKATDGDGTIVYGSGNNIGPCEAQTIVVTEPTTMTNGTFLNPTHVYLHETITMNSAIMVGGYGGLTYEYRLQSMDAGTDTWTNLVNWSSTIPTHVVDQSDEGDKLRFQTRATDSVGNTKLSNSGTATVAVSTEIGTVSTAPPGPLQMDPGEMVGFTAANSGDADPLFLWAIRSGPANITSMYNFGPTAEVTINPDAGSGDTVQVQVTADDPSATDTPQSTVVTIIVN
jgi:hypothetical protein